MASSQWYTVDIGTRFSTVVHDSFYIFSAFNFLFLSSNERFVLLFAFAFRLLSFHLLSRYFSRSPVPRVQQCDCNSNDFTRLASFIVSLIFFTTFLGTFQSCLLYFFFSSTDFLLTSSWNHQTTARIIVLCVKCFCFCCDYQQPLWLRCVAFVWLLWRRSKNVPSCRLDSGHFDQPMEMIHTVWRKWKKSVLVVFRALLFYASFEIAPPLSDQRTSLSNYNPLKLNPSNLAIWIITLIFDLLQLLFRCKFS